MYSNRRATVISRSGRGPIMNTAEQQDDDMWEHVCRVERTVMFVGKNEECNWCGETEGTYQLDVHPTNWFKTG